MKGKRRNKNYPKPNEKEIVLPPNSQALLPHLLALLRDMPYLRFVRLKHHGVSLKRTGDSDWSIKIKDNKQTAKYFYREQIASAYQMKGECHWGKTKAKIRKLLLPKANKLLQLASVQRMLLEAELKGNKVVVSSGFVFWFEDNESIGWVVKEASYSKADENGNTLWKTGVYFLKIMVVSLFYLMFRKMESACRGTLRMLHLMEKQSLDTLMDM